MSSCSGTSHAAEHPAGGIISVSGQGSVAVTPDQGSLSLAINKTGQQLGPLQSTIDREISALVSHFRSRGFEARDIRTTQINIRPRYRYDNVTKRQIEDGYHIDRSLVLTVRDLSQLGDIINDAVDLGITSVSPPRLSYSHAETAYQQALAAALRQARARAQVLAEGSGMTLGAPVTIDATRDIQPPVVAGPRLMASADHESGAYHPGETAIEARITVQFSLEQR